MTKAGTTKDPGITRIGVVGCGYVADLYAQTLSAHPELVVQGLYDLNPERLAAHASCHNRLRYDSLDYMLADPAVELVVNLTNPEAHHAVSHAALLAGKHVYSEKPLGVDLSEAKALMALAEEKGLLLGSAPCNHLAEATEALAELIRNQALGSVCSVHAQMDDGMLPGLDFEHWRSISGAPWPYEDEFRMGVTLEHAGYSLVPLVYLFGPVRKVIAYAANRVPDKGARLGVDPAVTRDDMSWAILEFDRGVVARLTTSVLAPIDRSIRIIGTEAVATLADVWDYRTQVRIAPTGKTKRHKVFRKI
ncbi:MAG: Gfo/Idh/MocA family protein, partial [Rhodospirillaceae bacterium]